MLSGRVSECFLHSRESQEAILAEFVILITLSPEGSSRVNGTSMA